MIEAAPFIPAIVMLVAVVIIACRVSKTGNGPKGPE